MTKGILLAGAGDAGRQLALELRRHPELTAVGFLDDDPDKQGQEIAGLRVLGTTSALAAVLAQHPADELLVTMPSAPPGQVRAIADAAASLNLRCRILPGIARFLTDVGIPALQRVDTEELLGREPARIDTEAVRDSVEDRTVLVTGGGGSIGLEIARQLAQFQPARIVLLDQDENALYEADLALAAERPETPRTQVVGSVRDTAKIAAVMADARPDVVFHAAAHKHVPMMQANPDEAILNNVGGTRVVAEAARDAGVKRLVNISTDKAVNPVSFLGYTKLLAERIVRDISRDVGADQAFMSVRFGNVLGSRGSVIPIFERQVAAGGPLTVTDPEMTRFLMTIQEASQLVIQAGAFADNGAVYVLDMGEPVRIGDLARDMVRLSGQGPDDIDIVVIGRRPGEKMHEELFASHEHPSPTRHPRILMATDGDPGPANAPEGIDGLLAAAAARDRAEIDRRMASLFPDYSASEATIS